MASIHRFCFSPVFSKTVVTTVPKQLFIVLILSRPFLRLHRNYNNKEIEKFEREAKEVKQVIRDSWGVPHIYGKTDASAVFGLMYTECEDNFKGIEQNYLYQLGKQSEVDGEKSLYTDVTLQLIADTADAINDYKASAPWFKKLMDAIYRWY